MKTMTFIAATLAALSLTGCDHGLGVSAKSERSVTTQSETSHATEAKTGASKTMRATVSMPALALALDALRPIAREPDPDPDKPGDTMNAVRAARIIVGVAKPVYGWPVACFGCARQDAWARAQARRLSFADLVLTQTLAALPPGALADPAAARAAIRSAFLAIPTASLDAAWRQAGDAVRGKGVVENFSGGGGVAFQVDGLGAYEGSAAGWSWVRNGTPWLGDGAVGGRKIELALDSAIDTGVSTTSGTSTSTGAGTTQSSGGDVGVK